MTNNIAIADQIANLLIENLTTSDIQTIARLIQCEMIQMQIDAQKRTKTIST
jgi:hypothetical protein